MRIGERNMEIRTNRKYYRKLKNQKTPLKNIQITLDENIEIPVVMIKDQKGELREYLRGFKEVKHFLKYGYNRIIKKCPFRHRKCIGEKCQLYFVQNGTGDCVLIWQMFKG